MIEIRTAWKKDGNHIRKSSIGEPSHAKTHELLSSRIEIRTSPVADRWKKKGVKPRLINPKQIWKDFKRGSGCKTQTHKPICHATEIYGNHERKSQPPYAKTHKLFSSRIEIRTGTIAKDKI